jgi:hypothetical protein
LFSYSLSHITNYLQFFQWDTLGTAPGRIGRKLSDEELAKIRYIHVREDHLLEHAEVDLGEWQRFTGLQAISVECNCENLDSGGMFGHDMIMEYSEEISGEVSLI